MRVLLITGSLLEDLIITISIGPVSQDRACIGGQTLSTTVKGLSKEILKSRGPWSLLHLSQTLSPFTLSLVYSTNQGLMPVEILYG